MYLIFLALAVAQIPVGWLDNNIVVREYLYARHIPMNELSVKSACQKLETIKTAFNLFINQNNKSNGNKSSYTYTLTDEYFIKMGSSHRIFIELSKLYQWTKQLHVSDKRKQLFQNLFQEDLKNGLSTNDSNLWAQYKWKHVPQYMAINLLNEMILRTQLLEVQTQTAQSHRSEPALSLIAENPMMHVGDEAFFKAKGDSLKEIHILRNETPVNDFSRTPDGFVFKPQAVGEYTLMVKGNYKSESIKVSVLPAGFVRENNSQIRVFYKGLTSQQKVPFAGMGMNIKCNQDANAAFIPENKISFCPVKEGWCTITITKENNLIMLDSVFVKALPEPLIRIKGIPSQTISRSRIQKGTTLQLQAFHPSFEEGTFKVASFQYRLIGKSTIEKASPNGELILSEKESEELSYLVVHEIKVKAGKEIISIHQPVILQIQ